MPNQPKPFVLSEKILEKLDRCVIRGEVSACWLWSGPTNQGGYGLIQICEGADQMSLLAHRVAYQVEHGAIPAGMLVLHGCDTPRCCNPAHLRPGALRDKMDRGRHRVTMTGRRGLAHPRALHGEAVRARALEMHREGRSRVGIAAELGCHRTTVSRWIEEAELLSGVRLEPSRTLRRSRPAGSVSV